MPVLNTGKLEEVAINTEGAMPRTRSNMGFLALKGKSLYDKLVNKAKIRSYL